MRILVTFFVVASWQASAQSNLELAKLYAEDQADRTNQFTLTAEQKSTMLKNDGPRRKRVREMVESGALRTSEDYVRAAIIFQHGAGPNDYLLAHVLGMIATKLDGSGIWISAASLDRYLLETGKSQIFGLTLSDSVPFDKTLLPDPLREAVCAPSIANRAKFMAAVAKDPAHPPVNNPCAPELKSLVGKWLLTRKSASGDFTHLTIDISLDANGEPDMAISGPGIPAHPDMRMTLGGENLEIGFNGEVFHLSLKGDVMTGSYTSASSAGTVVGMR